MKTFKKISKLKNPMKDLDLLMDFINTTGKVDKDYSNENFFEVGRFKGSISSVDYLKTRRLRVVFYLPDYKGCVYIFDFCLETNKVKQKRVYEERKEHFIELKELFLKFLLNKELLKLENKPKEKTRKI